MQAKVPKKQDWPNSKPGQPGVAVTDRQTHHHTSVISTSSIFSAGLRWFCVGGGELPDLSGNHHTVSQLPDSVAEASKSDQSLIQGHGHPGALRNVLGICAFNLIFIASYIEKDPNLLWMK